MNTWKLECIISLNWLEYIYFRTQEYLNMNTKGKDGKKRIAHVGSSSSSTIENVGEYQKDYLASIMEQMDSNDKQIVSYEQLNDYRKSKFKPVLPDIDFTQPTESSGSFKLKKKLCPLMAKCQKNLKYIKHNRCIPKPRAHVGPLSKETPSVKLSKDSRTKDNVQIKPSKVQKNDPSRSFPLHSKTNKPALADVDKPKEEGKDMNLKPQECTKTKNGKLSKPCELESSFPVETNSNDRIVSGVKNDSSEESDSFESFIKQQVSSHSKKTSQHESNKKRKKAQKRKVFKRIKERNASSSENDSDIEERFPKTALNKSSVANKLTKSQHLEDVNDSDSTSKDNSIQFEFDNACDDDSDICDEALVRTASVDKVSNSSFQINKDSKTVEQSTFDILRKDLSFSSKTDCSFKLSTCNEINYSDNSFPTVNQISKKQESCESKSNPLKDQVEGYESDDCMILENPYPVFDIQISAVKSVAMLPTSDEDESSESISPQKKENECTPGIMSQEDNFRFNHESLANIKNPNKDIFDESDDCIILEDELSELVDQNSSKPVENCANRDITQSEITPVNFDQENSIKHSICDTHIVEDSKESLASSRYKPDTIEDKNVWDALKAIDFEKLKSLPQQSLTESTLLPCNSVSNSQCKGNINKEELNHAFLGDQIQNSLLSQEKPCSVHAEYNINDSTLCQKNVELISISDDEDNSQNNTVESMNRNKCFVTSADTTIESSSSCSQKYSNNSSKCSSFESKIGDVSSSSVLDDSDLNFHKSLVSNDFSHKFPLEQEPTNLNIPVKKEAPASTSDELDISSASSLQNLYSSRESDVQKLLDLYQREYQQYKEIQNTGRNLSDGLHLLLNKQVNKLMNIKSSIKNIVKYDPCFLKLSKDVKTDLKPIKCDAIVKKEPVWEEESTKQSYQLSKNILISDSEHSELSIYTDSVIQGVQKVVGSSLPTEKVKEQLRNAKCARCGQIASAACQGCFQVFYCSTECGISDWEKGHSVSCGM